MYDRCGRLSQALSHPKRSASAHKELCYLVTLGNFLLVAWQHVLDVVNEPDMSEVTSEKSRVTEKVTQGLWRCS